VGSGGIYKKNRPAALGSVLSLCAEGGSRTHNPQGNASLSRARLPVPPLRLVESSIPKREERVKIGVGPPFLRRANPGEVQPRDDILRTLYKAPIQGIISKGRDTMIHIYVDTKQL
jgi:hypothetical protein